MADVVHEHPARPAAEGEAHRAERVGRDARGRPAERGAGAADGLHAPQVPEVLLAQRGLDLAPQGAHVGEECREVGGSRGRFMTLGTFHRLDQLISAPATSSM
jgi:hypothetical protein